MTTNTDAARTRGTAEWQDARFESAAALNTLAQVAIEIDGEQLDMFAV